jgi:hypothetical protein
LVLGPSQNSAGTKPKSASHLTLTVARQVFVVLAAWSSCTERAPTIAAARPTSVPRAASRPAAPRPSARVSPCLPPSPSPSLAHFLCALARSVPRGCSPGPPWPSAKPAATRVLAAPGPHGSGHMQHHLRLAPLDVALALVGVRSHRSQLAASPPSVALAPRVAGPPPAAPCPIAASHACAQGRRCPARLAGRPAAAVDCRRRSRSPRPSCCRGQPASGHLKPSWRHQRVRASPRMLLHHLVAAGELSNGRNREPSASPALIRDQGLRAGI